MRNYFLITLLLLNACAMTTADYRPDLASAPKDRVKYEEELAYCKAWAKPTPQEDARETNAQSSLLGYAMVKVYATGKERPLHFTDRVDQCMTKRGYILK